MDSILQQITDWLKEMLISAIMGNLSGMFESVNNQVGEIATSVGRTPESFSPEIFAMVRNISESVIIPIAGLILTFIACYELIQLIIDHNNLANFETWIFFKWVFKTFVAVMLITNTFNITMAVFDVAQHVVNASGGIIAGNTAIDASGLEALEETLQGMDLGPLIGLLLQSFVVQITMSALAIIIFVIVYRILNVTLTNYGLGNVIASSRLTAEQWERYKVLLETLGNRSYLFGEDVSSAPGGGGEYTDYDIPGEALTDTAFANMVREAEKYLGYPYVWGGSSPSTSFDCSGFVSWVINNCGNGWSVGRQTANGLKNLCDIIPPSEAKPGDLIFFQGTYNTSGASHVGIYVGNGMMIHCGDPISYASIETNYWQQHFYCFGRIP